MFVPVSVSSFHSHVEGLSRPVPSCGGADGFDVELDALYSLQSSPSALAAVYSPTLAEQHKNRYCELLPNSSSRIRLRSFEGCFASDYVNASLVAPDSFPFPAYPYIAAQAPLASCVPDFWHMVWEQHSGLIVMLTKEKERAKDDSVIRKADRYWPASIHQTLTLGSLTVALTHSTPLTAQHVQQIRQGTEAADASSASLTELLAACQSTEASSPSSASSSSSSSSSLTTSGASSSSASSSSQSLDGASDCPIVVREFVLSVGTEQRTCRQLHYVGWPDHGVPSDLASFVSLFQLYRSLRSVTSRTAPIIVHCSAGIGRTGTFCTIDLALDQLSYSIQQQQQQREVQPQQQLDSDSSATDGTAAVRASPPPPAKQAAVSVSNLVRLLRVSRAGMVQTKGQYQFCYRFLDFCILNRALINWHFPSPPAAQLQAQQAQNGHGISSNSSSTSGAH